MRMSIFKSVPAIAFGAILMGCAGLPAPQPVQDAPSRQLVPGSIPDGTIFIRDIRGRILFSGPSQDYRFGREIRIHAYDIERALDVSIENEAGTLVSQRLGHNSGRSVGIFYNRALGGFKQRFYEPEFHYDLR